jgi:iron complex outermembrane receptor protein
VYAASKFVQDVAQAPASVTIIGADEIRRHGYRTLADVLRSVRGFYVTYDRDYSYVGVRGFLRPGDYNGRVLLLVDGHRLNDTVFEQALLGTESPLDVNLFDRVEVIRGPSSSLYGTSAFFAVVNLITRTGHGLQGVEAEVDAGSQAMRKGRFTAGGRNARGFEGLFSVSAYETDGNTRIYYPDFDTPQTDTGFATAADGDRATSLFASGSAGGFTAQLGAGSRTKTIPTAAFGTLFNDPRTETTDVRGFADLQYSRRLDPRTRIELRGGYDHYAYDGTYAYDTGLFNDGARGDWLTTEATIVRQMGRHAVTAGAEYRDNFTQDQSARDETGVLLDDRRVSDTAALYVEDEIRLHPRLIVNAGVRWDEYFGIFGGTVNPRLAAIVTPFDGSTLKLLYGRAFRAPNPFELYYDQNALSARLEPERIHTYEIDWEQRLAPRLQATASVYRNHVFGLITERAGDDETLDGLYFRNGDNVTADGVEFELQGELPAHVHARIAQAFQSATLDSGDLRISNAPRTLSTFVLDAPVPRTDAIIALDGFYIGARRPVSDGSVPGALVTNLTVSRRPSVRGLGVGVTIYNLFDTKYADPGSVEHTQQALPQDGRTAAVRLSWRF